MKHILIIRRTIKNYMKLLYSMSNISYNSHIINYKTINAFLQSEKNKNDLNNKLRESIIGAIINNKMPNSYYQYSKRWNCLKKIIWDYIQQMSLENITTISCHHRGGRKYHYDFTIILNDVHSFNVEFKFNAEKIKDIPQFVSPMNPSQYLSSSYENYYYEKYLPILATLGEFKLPEKEIYLKEVNMTSPPCLADFQTKYYNGCNKSSKYTGNINDIQFYNEANKLSRNSITSFIKVNDLDFSKLSQHLQNTQVSKHYMLYHNNIFHHHIADYADYEIISCEKYPEKYKYVTTSKNGCKMTILLRWKNGNGIALPAFQIK